MNRVLRGIVWGLLLPSLCAAQDMPAFGQGARPGMGEIPSFLHVEAVNMPAEDTSRCRVDVIYRIDQNFLVPVKNPDPAAAGPFLRRGELLIEVVDSSGSSQARTINRIEISDDVTDRPTHEKRWYKGVTSFLISPGRYRLQVELSDLESKRTFLNDRTPLIARALPPNRFALSDPLFVMRGTLETMSDTLVAGNFGGDLLFSSSQDLLLYVTGVDTSRDLLVEHTLSVMGRNPEDSTTVERVGPTPRPARSHMTLVPSARGGEVTYSANQSLRPSGGFILLPLGTQLLPLRHFMLRVKVTQGTKEASLSKPFNVVWPEMPLSLKDVDRALDLLRYITTERVLDSLKQGSFEERRDHLEAFWKERDKTPSTAFNEVQTEYYRRVDFANREYASLKQPEGWRSDRGKAFILYGPPTNVHRSLDPVEGFKEVWRYERLNKKLTFADQNKNGDYVLATSTSL